jgi:hypothetical protein
MDQNGKGDAQESEDDFEFYSPAYLEGLLEKAKASATKEDNSKKTTTHEEEILFLQDQDENTLVLSLLLVLLS